MNAYNSRDGLLDVLRAWGRDPRFAVGAGGAVPPALEQLAAAGLFPTRREAGDGRVELSWATTGGLVPARPPVVLAFDADAKLTGFRYGGDGWTAAVPVLRFGHDAAPDPSVPDWAAWPDDAPRREQDAPLSMAEVMPVFQPVFNRVTGRSSAGPTTAPAATSGGDDAPPR